MTASCLYEGVVTHRRSEPAVEFRHPLTLLYLDLDELPGLLGGRLVRGGIGPLRFRRADYLGDPRVPLADTVRATVAERLGDAPEGPVRLLTQVRSFGVCFNPVSFYYCFAADGERLEAVVAEVTNTPWGERHAYVIAGSGGPVAAGSFDKELHVSPFMGMDHAYECRATVPGDMLSVHIDSSRSGRVAFGATLSMRRSELDRAAVVRTVARYPFASVRVLALIYAHALQLRLAGASVFPHPQIGGAS